MAEYIEREAFMKKFCERCDEEMPDTACEPTECFAMNVIKKFPSADVAQVRPELRKAVKELHKQYEMEINSPAVRNPLAWALYRTWKQMDGEDQKCLQPTLDMWQSSTGRCAGKGGIGIGKMGSQKKRKSL